MSSHNRKSHAINNMPREWALQWPKKFPFRFELEMTHRIAGILESPSYSQAVFARYFYSTK